MSNLKELLNNNWKNILIDEFEKAYFKKLETYLEKEFEEQLIYPDKNHIFNAFNHTDYDNVKLLLLGQDPYHGEGQAHGLSFSVPEGVKLPPSLKNMYKELNTDLGITPSKNGNLTKWADQGVLLLNAVLTVRQASPASHKNQGWETFTDNVIKKLNEREKPLVFLLWGNYAKNKANLIDSSKHIVIQGTHPSPLSANNGFFGSKPFSSVNTALKKLNEKEIDWSV